MQKQADTTSPIPEQPRSAIQCHWRCNRAAPIIIVEVLSSSKEVEVLPDSEADIPAARQEALKTLGQCIDNLLLSHIIPRAVNGSCMTPIGSYQSLFNWTEGGALIFWCNNIMKGSQRAKDITRPLPSTREST